jgi:hypothetical protein
MNEILTKEGGSVANNFSGTICRGGSMADSPTSSIVENFLQQNHPANFGIVRTQGNQPRLIQLALRYTF